MAEFCLDCLRKLDGKPYKPEKLVISKDLELCEGCGQWRHVVVARRTSLHLGVLGVLIDALKSLFRWMKAKISG